VPGPLFTPRQPGAARPDGRRDRRRRGADVVRRRDTGGRHARARRLDAVALCHRGCHRGRMARLYHAGARSGGRAMTGASDVADRILRRNLRARREIITPEGVPLVVELAEFSERAIALVIDLVLWLIASFVFLAILGFGIIQGMSAVVLV